MMTSTSTATSRSETYALGHTSRELDRLSLQARVLEPFTRQLLLDAGIGPGMQVLDVGCGSGDVTFLLAGIVGGSGHVVGMDRSDSAIARANERAQRAGIRNVSFMQADLTEADPGREFDAVVGRLVLMYQADPGAAIAALARHLRRGGVAVFQEFDVATARAVPEVPLLSCVADWISRAFAVSGAELRMGMKLHPAFRAAGLPAPAMRLDGIVGGAPDFVGYDMVADILRSLMPLVVKAGIATPEEVDVETLAGRLREEIAERRSTLVIPELVGAWAALP